MDDLRGGMTPDQAGAAIAVLLAGRIVAISAHADGGWSVEMENITKHAVDLLQDQETFHYCHIETIHEDDMAFYREAVMQAVPPVEGATGTMIEGVYQRRIATDERPDATFTGRVAYAPADQWTHAEALVEQSFAERTLAEYVNNLSYVHDGMRTILYHLQRRLSPEAMAPAMAMMGRVNRTVIEMGIGHAA